MSIHSPPTKKNEKGNENINRGSYVLYVTTLILRQISNNFPKSFEKFDENFMKMFSKIKMKIYILIKPHSRYFITF